MGAMIIREDFVLIFKLEIHRTCIAHEKFIKKNTHSQFIVFICCCCFYGIMVYIYFGYDVHFVNQLKATVAHLIAFHQIKPYICNNYEISVFVA